MIKNIMKKTVITGTLLSLLMSNSYIVPIKAASEVEKVISLGNVSYTIQGNEETKTCTITNIIMTKEENELVIPETIDGMAVNKITGTKKANDAYRNVFGLRAEYNADVYDNAADWGLYAPAKEGTESNEEDDLNTDALTKIVVPDTVKELGEFTFAGLENVEEIQLSEQLNKVGIYSFLACPDLTTINIPKGWTKGVEKITYGRKWKSFSIDKNNTSYQLKKGLLLSKDGKKLYAAVTNNEKTLKIPKGVEKMISNQYIEKAWRGNLMMPVKVKSGYERYSKITLPASMKSIAGQIFTMDKNCEITIAKGNKTLAKQKNCIYNKKTGRLLVVKVNKKGVLKIASKVKVLGAKTSVIGGDVKKIIVPKTVKKLKKDCFVFPMKGNEISIFLKGKNPPKAEVATFRGVIGNVYVPVAKKKVYKKWMKKVAGFLHDVQSKEKKTDKMITIAQLDPSV